jgi:hypothetical protein
MAPSAQHRGLWREGAAAEAGKHAQVIVGLAFLVPAMVGAVFVVSAFIFGLATALVVTKLLILFFGLLWFVLPLRYLRDGD